MDIRLNQIGKKFNRKWILRHVDMDMKSGGAYAILGANGSGKSTLMKMISGYLLPSEGERWIENEPQGQLSPDHERVSFVAPYVDLYRDMSLQEAIDFHFSFKKKNDRKVIDMMDDLSLPLKRELKDFSSGMLQRVKLSLAFCTDSRLLLLDEPLMNLDAKGVAWYRGLLDERASDQTVVVASNERTDEFDFCTDVYHIKDRTVEKS